MICAYCQKNQGRTVDHLISKSASRRVLEAAMERENPAYKVRACSECNVSKGTLLRVPPSHAHLIGELQRITRAAYGIYDGTPESLREVVR